MYVLLVLVYKMVNIISTIFCTAWQRQWQNIGKPTNPQLTPEILGENCEYIDKKKTCHHSHDVIMITIASQITSLTFVYSIGYFDADQRKHQSSSSLAFVWGIHRNRWILRIKGQSRGKCFHLMTSSWSISRYIRVCIRAWGTHKCTEFMPWANSLTPDFSFGMMTLSNGNIFRATGPLCGEFTGPGEFPAQRPVTRSFDVSFDLRPNKRLSKQPWGWRLETASWSLWRQYNGASTTLGYIWLSYLISSLWIQSGVKTMKLLIFLILLNQLYRKQKFVNGDGVFLTVTRHRHME